MRYILYTIIVAIDLYAIFLPSASAKTFLIKAPVMDMEYQADMAQQYLNTLRTHAGMAAYRKSSILTTAANAHAHYLIVNHEIGHYEIPGHRDFTGKNHVDRAAHAGYKVGMLTENVSTNSINYKDSVDSLFSAIYHRFGFLDFQSDEIGIGVAQNQKDTDYNAFVYDMGIYHLNFACTQESYHGVERYAYKICLDPAHRIREDRLLEILSAQKRASKKIIIYPYANQSDVSPVFYDESPDPLPDSEVSGFPITVQFNDYYIKDATIRSISLFGPDKKELPSKILYWQNDPNHLMKKNQYALMPEKRLDYATTYHVVLVYKSAGKRYEKRWSFRTRELPKPYFVIEKAGQEITIKPHTTYTLYFPPKNAHDVLGSLHFPADVKVRFLDLNTIQLKLDSDNKAPFVLKSGDKSVDIQVG